MSPLKIPQSAIARLSLYYRALSESRSNNVSSYEISRLTGFSDAQIRRDLTYFGQFGTPGRGYDVEQLKSRILKILGIDKKWRIALIGIGNLGSALLNYKGFKTQGMEIVTAFDKDAMKIGKFHGGIQIEDIRNLARVVKGKRIKMAIIAVPASTAISAINNAVASGIKAILNFAPIRIKVPPTVALLNIDIGVELERLSYFTKRLPRS